MAIIESILAGGFGTALSAAGSLLKDIREAITGKAILDPNKQAELVLRAQEIENGIVLAQMSYEKAQLEGQLKINQSEAESASIFKGGWRPAVGWVCVCGLGYEFLLRPILPWLIQVGALVTGMASVAPVMPETSMGDLMTILLGILGLGGLRTYEKAKRVASK
jgi:hypothetical protein